MTEHTHQHRHHAREAAPKPAPVETIVSVVYVTASKTFAGDIAGYTTIGVEDPEKTTSSTKAAVKTTSSVSSKTSTKSSTLDTSIRIATSKSSSSSAQTIILAPSTSVAASLALLAASTTTSATIASADSTSSSSASAASASSTSSADSSSGMSSGGKVGLAFGIICLVGAVLALILFFFKKRRDALKHDRLEDEKHDVFAANAAVPAGRAPSTHSAQTGSTAPRLSLRPVTQFLPNLSNEKRQSRGNALTVAVAQNRPLPPPGGVTRSQVNQEQSAANPFGAHAETIDSPNANGPAVIETVNANGAVVSAAATAGAATAVGLARGASKRGNGPKPLDLTKRPNSRNGATSPAGTEFSMSSEMGTPVQAQSSQTGAAIAAAGGPVNSAVYRVQLDFKPSMDDELALNAGQLIRLLHEYDDGWALCIRLDRSQQGVVPRTCLSTRPVKPRPQQNGPRGPGGPGMRGPPGVRPMSPGMNQGPPGSAQRPMNQTGNQGPRAMVPSGSPKSPNQPRPMTPGGMPQRSVTPSTGSQESTTSARPMTPTGQQQRPMTPQGQQQRPMTPQGQFQGQSVSQEEQAEGRPRAGSIPQLQPQRFSPPQSPVRPASEMQFVLPEIAISSPPRAEARPQGPPPAAIGAVGRKPVPGQAL